MNQFTNPRAGFLQKIVTALAQLKQRLQLKYEQAYPDLHEIIDIVLEEEEAKAWDLSLFPHLIFADLVEVHIANLNLRPVETKHDDAFAQHHFNEIATHQPAFTLCG